MIKWEQNKIISVIRTFFKFTVLIKHDKQWDIIKYRQLNVMPPPPSPGLIHSYSVHYLHSVQEIQDFIVL